MASTSSAIAPTVPSFAEFDRRARAGEPMSVVFFGGSLTWGANASDPQTTSYRALMGAYLRSRYPRVPFVFHDAAIGGTGSNLGIFRLDRDVLSRKPDLVFLDFTANDGLESERRPPLATYEAILRELIEQGIPVVQAFFGFRYNFGEKYDLAQVPRRRDHLLLAAAYNTGIGDAFLLVQTRLTSGAERLESLWPFDVAHPDDCGYRLFFEAVRQGFDESVSEGRVCRVPVTPVFSSACQRRTRHRLVEHALPAGWTRQATYRTSLWFDGLSSRWMDDVAMCSAGNPAPIQPLRLEFTGTLVGLFGEADQDGLGFRTLIDGQPALPQPSAHEPDANVWSVNTKRFGTGRLFAWRVLADELKPGRHVLEIHPDIPPGITTGQLRIESICFAGES